MFSVSWDMNFTDIAQKSTYQIFFGTDGDTPTYALQMTVQTTGKVSLSDINTTGNSMPHRKETTLGTISAGWHKFCVEYAIVDGGCIANIWVDGDFVASSDNFYDYRGTLTSPASIGNMVRISTTSNVKATMLLDNVSANYVTEIKEPPVYEGTNDFEYYDVGKCYVLGTTFTLSNGSMAVETDSVKPANKALKLYTKNSGNSVSFNFYGEKSNAVVLEFDIRFSDVNSESSYQLSLGGSYVLQITPNTKGTCKIIDRNDVNTWSAAHYKSKSFTGENPISTSEWHRIRIEYSINESTCEAKVYIDGTLAGTSDHFYNGGGTKTAPSNIGTSATFKSTGGGDATVWFDNVTALYVE
jgi:hypothetical protein